MARRATGLLTVLLGALVLAGPAAADETLDAGGLTVTAAADPWGLSFRDARGPVLTELGAAAGPSGSLGFSVGDNWFHATRATSMLRDGNTVSATLATNDPAGRTLRVHIRPDGDGIIAVEASVIGGVGGTVSRTGVGFRAATGERYLGFGERGNAVDQRGNVVENFVSDGPYLESERALIAGFVPPQGYSPRDDATYFPIPWLVSTNGYGVLVDNDERSYFRLGSESADAWSTEVEAGRLSFRVFAGPRPADVVRRFSKRLGRQPRAAPFFYGPWFQPKGGDAQSIDTLRKADVPSSVANTYTHYLPCGDQEGKTDEQRARTKLFHDNGIAVTTYFNPMICQGGHPQFDQAASEGVLTKNALGQPYTYRYTGSQQFLVGQFDFSAAGTDSFFHRLLKEAVDDGYDGWMEDFGEYTPADSVPADTTYNGAQMHNRYVTLYHGSANRFSNRAGRPLARFNRSGWTGTAQHSQIVWGGDPTTDWGFDGLESSMKQALTMGLSGVSIWGSDIGGYFTIAAPQLSPELLKRWIQFGFASGVMRTEANGFVVGDKGPRAQIFDPDVLPVWRRYAKLRTQLYPYLIAADEEYWRTGMPIMRHLSLVFPDDPRAGAREDEYMFGPDLLAAPVVEEGATTRKLYVPRGRWYDLWRSAEFVKGDGSLRLGRPTAVTGGREATVPAPLDELPLLVRAGAILPLLPPDVDTLTDYGRDDPKIVTLGERITQLRLIVFPRGRSARKAGKLRWVSTEGKDRWTLVAKTGPRKSYRVQASMASLKRPFKPACVTLGGKPLSRRAWSYDAKRHVLEARFAGRGTLRLAAVRQACEHRR